MRLSNNDTNFIYDDSNNLMGVNLGWDFVAEHEFGIKGMFDIFHIEKKECEKLDTTIKEVPDKLLFSPILIDKQTYYILTLPFFKFEQECFTKKGYMKNKYFSYFDFYKFKLEKNNIIASWDEHSFAICVNKENKKNLKEIYNSFLNKDIIICFQKNDNPFANKGLCFLIKSKTPKKILKNI